jgi:peptidoglycan/xylan/chitin deacetylase (PgdA/CDA1 family)
MGVEFLKIAIKALILVLICVPFYNSKYLEAEFIDENVMLCNSIPIAIPTDSEKQENYIREYDGDIKYKKGVFLTFDDGPSKNTLKILNILKENNIKATFFVIGRSAELNPEVISKLKENGMCILSHSYSHDYGIYKGLDSYKEDLNMCNNTLSSLLQEQVLPIIRFPGGSTNSIWSKDIKWKVKDYLMRNNIRYIDWNVSSADAAQVIVPMDNIKDNVINQCKNKKLAVVLMHDAPVKVTTVEALPQIIKELKKNGNVFRSFDDLSKAEEEELLKLKIMDRM